MLSTTRPIPTPFPPRPLYFPLHLQHTARPIFSRRAGSLQRLVRAHERPEAELPVVGRRGRREVKRGRGLTDGGKRASKCRTLPSERGPHATMATCHCIPEGHSHLACLPLIYHRHLHIHKTLTCKLETVDFVH